MARFSFSVLALAICAVTWPCATSFCELCLVALPANERLRLFRYRHQIVEKLEAIASRKKITPAQLALAWVAAQGTDIIPIPGTKSVPRLEENWASRNVIFTPEELKELREVIDGFSTSGDRYPEQMLKHIGK